MLDLSKDEGTSGVDAALPWKPVTIEKDVRKKYNESMERMDLGAKGKTASEMDSEGDIREDMKKVDEKSLGEVVSGFKLGKQCFD